MDIHCTVCKLYTTIGIVYISWMDIHGMAIMQVSNTVYYTCILHIPHYIPSMMDIAVM